MKILGINISHDSSSCLIEDGKLIYFIEDEKLNRKKSYLIGNDNVEDINNGCIPVYFIDKLKTYTTNVDYVIFSSFERYSDSNDDLFSDKNFINLYLKEFQKNGITVGEYVFDKSKHHFYHAANAFYGSGFDDAVCLVMDGGGTFYKDKKVIEQIFGRTDEYFREVESFYQFSYGKTPRKLKQVWAHCHETDTPETHNIKSIDDNDEVVFHSKNDVLTSTWSNGILFNILSSCLGFRDGRDSGKTMGLASYHSDLEEKEPYEEIDWFVNVDGEEITSSKLKKILFGLYEYSDYNLPFDKDNFESHLVLKANLAKKLQDETLKHTNNLISQALKLSSSKNIVLSGGYSLNCLNNYQYLDNIPEGVNLYIDPICNDAGTAMGAALYLWYKLSGSKEKFDLNSLYLG
jgi:carbamoyltransferase